MSDLLEVRISCPDDEVAERIARTLVEERLAACAQILPGVASVYRWHGVVATDAEQLLLVKTTSSHFDALAARVGDLHPYDVPEILAVPIAAFSEPYAAWLRENLG